MEKLEQRRILKRKKPTFMRQDSHKKGKLKNNWRKPKGSDSKMRVNRKGYSRCVKIGWGSPADVRGMTPDGLRPVIVCNVSDLSGLDPKVDCVIISSSVGTKKAIILLEAVAKAGLKVANLKDASKHAEDLKGKFNAKKELAKKKKLSRSDKREKTKKEAEKAKKEEEKKAKKSEDSDSSEEKKLEEKKEKDKILTQRQ